MSRGPKNYVPYAFHLYPEDLEKMRAAAREREISVSEYVRNSVRLTLEEADNDPEKTALETSFYKLNAAGREWLLNAAEAATMKKEFRA